jgi:hypothetical protein
MTRNQRLALLVALLVVAASVAVGVVLALDDDDERASSTSASASNTTTSTSAPSTTTTAEPATTTTATCAPVPGADLEAKEGPAPSGGMLVDGLEVASTTDGCADTVVFTFSTASAPEEPGYRVEYRSGPFTMDASGAPVTVDGAAFLVVRLEPAYGYDFENGDVTYRGPDDFRPLGTRVVSHAVLTGDYEGVVTWVFGLTEQRPFRVLAAGAPERQLIIEIT